METSGVSKEEPAFWLPEFAELYLTKTQWRNFRKLFAGSPANEAALPTLKAEAIRLLDLSFANFDADGNGSVTCVEFQDFANTLNSFGAMSEDMVKILISGFDVNSDGVLSKWEFHNLLLHALSDEFGDTRSPDNESWWPFVKEHFLTKAQARNICS